LALKITENGNAASAASGVLNGKGEEKMSDLRITCWA